MLFYGISTWASCWFVPSLHCGSPSSHLENWRFFWRKKFLESFRFSVPTYALFIMLKATFLKIHEGRGWEMLSVTSKVEMESQRKPVRCPGDSPGSWLAPHLLPAAEVLVRQGPFNGELCWEWWLFPGQKSKKQDQSLFSKWIKELIRKVWLCCSDQNLWRLLNGIMLCQREKRIFPIDSRQVGTALCFDKILKKYT